MKSELEAEGGYWNYISVPYSVPYDQIRLRGTILPPVGHSRAFNHLPK